MHIKTEVAFTLKRFLIKFPKTKYIITHCNEMIEVTDSIIENYDNLEIAYCPTISEVIEYFAQRHINISVNKIDNNKWEWIIYFEYKNKTVYSGETVNGAIGHNIPEARHYFTSEYDAYNDAIVELFIII